MSELTKIYKTSHADIAIIYLEGEIDIHTAPQFERLVQSEMDAGHYRIIVGCEKLNYISSAGLGVFMCFIEEARDNGGDIKIFGMPSSLKDIIVTIGLTKIFDIVDDLPTAIACFTTSPTGKG